MKILIVDDSKSIYSVVSKMLTDANHSAFWAEDGVQAVEFLKTSNEKIDVILLDWNMPNMTGPEFLEYNLKEKLTTAPIVMMTTENSAASIKKALDLNAAEYIMKPFTADILLNKLAFLEMML